MHTLDSPASSSQNTSYCTPTSLPTFPQGQASVFKNFPSPGSVNLCGQCGKGDASILCGRCLEVYFCNEECQEDASSIHEKICIRKLMSAPDQSKEEALISISHSMLPTINTAGICKPVKESDVDDDNDSENLETDPTSYFFCACKWDKEQHAEALQSMSKKIATEPDNPEFYITRANLFKHLNRYSEAEQDYSHAISLDRENDIFFAH